LHSKRIKQTKQKAKKEKISLGENNFAQTKIPLARAKNLSLERK